MASDQASWLVIEHLLDHGDPAFVDELRRFHDPEQLAGFATRWYANQRLASRRLLLDYLNRPLNAFRHEPLVKRLFKIAEAAGDNRLLAQFMLALDRSVRRVRRVGQDFRQEAVDRLEDAHVLCRQWEAEGAEHVQVIDHQGRFCVVANWYPKKNRLEQGYFDNRSQAEDQLARWNKQGATNGHVRDLGGRYTVYGVWRGEQIVPAAGSTLPRGEVKYRYRNPLTGHETVLTDLSTRLGISDLPEGGLDSLPEATRERMQKMRLFSVHTRHYLRRRVWRYFRRLGKQHPERYVPALVEALKLYEDADSADGLALLDNWCLIHVLFHKSPVLVAKSNGWRLAPGKTLSELAPAPLYEELWQQSPPALLDLLTEARCRPVRQWAVRLIRRDATNVLKKLSLTEVVALLAHEDEEVVGLGAEALRLNPEANAISVERWLSLLTSANPASMEILTTLARDLVRPAQVSFEQAVRLAKSRPVPLARLGLDWLRTKTAIVEADCSALLSLIEAEAEPVRPDLVRWARGVLGASPNFQAAWVLEYLDSRHIDVREEGWSWLQAESRARDNVDLWRKLLESPYDDVRLNLVGELEKQAALAPSSFHAQEKLDLALIRFFWASVLLSIHRGGRAKPQVIGQLVRRLERQPEEAEELLPILSVGLRSIRGPEWRAGLAGVVRLIEQVPQLENAVQEKFPELRVRV